MSRSSSDIRPAGAPDTSTERKTGFVTRAGTSRLGVRFIRHVVSPMERALYRLSGGRLTLTRRAPVLLLTTTGRRTGKLRTVPVFYLREGTRIVVCNVTPPDERANPWPANLRANPRASVRLGADHVEVTGRRASDEEIAAFWPRLVEIWPAYQRFLDAGGTRSLFVLEPVEP